MEIVDPRIDPALVPLGSEAQVIAKTQPQYRDLPSVRTPGGQVITRWSPSAAERMALLRGEDIFVTILSSGAINPLFVTVGPVHWAAAETTEP